MKYIFLSLLFLTFSAQARLKIAATTTDLEVLATAVGGDQIEVFAVAKGTQDPHQIEAKPSFMLKFRDADLVLSQGLELETAWLLPLIQGARNPKINPGGQGFLELGPKLNPIEVVKGPVSRAEGDIHPEGNPHFQVDPVRMGQAAVLVAERLGDLDGGHRELYRQKAEAFAKSLQVRTQEWQKRIQASGVKEFVSYHKTLSYFADRFGLTNSLQLEPKPGIPPTASHLLWVTGQMKERRVKTVLIENFYDDAVRAKIEKEVPGVRIVKVPVSVRGEPKIEHTEDLIEKLVRALEGKSP